MRQNKTHLSHMDKATSQTEKSYRNTDRLRDIIDDDNLLLLVVNRFNIPLGFGDSTIDKICDNEGIDTETFLAVANLISNRPFNGLTISLEAVMRYLENAHAYFLDFILPSIREKLIKAINCRDANDVGFLILKYYDDYIAEVRRHMTYENDVIFPQIRLMLEGKNPGGVSIADYSAGHEDMVEKLQELKDIIIRHYPHTTNNILTYALYDIINVEADLMSHWQIENRLFMPAGIRLEQKMKTITADAAVAEHPRQQNASKNTDALSEREKEIIGLVAKGLSNKEIADSLCLSVHTVTTHRRNIAAKLQIHSPAGLTIYAILHNIIDISEIKNL